MQYTKPARPSFSQCQSFKGFADIRINAQTLAREFPEGRTLL